MKDRNLGDKNSENNPFDLIPLIAYFEKVDASKIDQGENTSFRRQIIGAAEKLFIDTEGKEFLYLLDKPQIVKQLLIKMQEIFNQIEQNGVEFDYLSDHLVNEDPITEFDELFQITDGSPFQRKQMLNTLLIQLANPSSKYNKSDNNEILFTLAAALVTIFIDFHNTYLSAEGIYRWGPDRVVTRPFTGFNPLPGHNDRSVTRPV